jgi:hypothetical protein
MALDVLQELGSYTGGTDAAATERIYAGEGRNLSEGARRRARSASPAYRQQITRVAEMYVAVLRGNRRAALDFIEAMSTSDFSFLFGDVLDRQMLAKYQSTPVAWDMFAKRGTVRDFRTVKRFTLDGGEAILDQVNEQAEYPAAKLADGDYEYRVSKHGRRIALSWETMINDDLDAFRDLPTRLGNAARRSEERFATALFSSSTGPNSTFYASGNHNIVTGDPALSIDGLQTAYTVLASQVDTDGAPIYIDGTVLVVPPALEVVARNIINATEILAAAGGGDGTGNSQLRTANWMQNKVRLVVNPWLPIIDTTHGSTAWYLFADPNVGRPAMEVGFLIGHDAPELFQKTPNAVRVGGGLIGPEEGDFDTDSAEWKLRHTFGGVLMDPKSSVASAGTA